MPTAGTGNNRGLFCRQNRAFPRVGEARESQTQGKTQRPAENLKSRVSFRHVSSVRFHGSRLSVVPMSLRLRACARDATAEWLTSKTTPPRRVPSGRWASPPPPGAASAAPPRARCARHQSTKNLPSSSRTFSRDSDCERRRRRARDARDADDARHAPPHSSRDRAGPRYRARQAHAPRRGARGRRGALFRPLRGYRHRRDRRARERHRPTRFARQGGAAQGRARPRHQGCLERER